jgi:hypothetical protein
VLFVSGYNESPAMQGVPTAQFLAKPFATQDLVRRVRALLDDASPPP